MWSASFAVLRLQSSHVLRVCLRFLIDLTQWFLNGRNRPLRGDVEGQGGQRRAKQHKGAKCSTTNQSLS